MNAGITRYLQYTKQFLDSLLLVHGEGGKSETHVCELTADILYRVSMLFKAFCMETREF
jgi:hypothetical protein